MFNREDHFCQTVGEIESIIMAERLRVRPELNLMDDMHHAFDLVNQQLEQNGAGAASE